MSSSFRRAQSSSTAVHLTLAAIVAVGAWLRFDGLAFGLPYALSRPDETALAGPAVMCLIGECAPPDFNYPSGFIYALTAVYLVMFLVLWARGVHADRAAFAESRRADVAPFFLASRTISALAGTATIGIVFAIGRLLWGAGAGLVSSFYLAISLLHVRESHFGTTDVTMTALVALAVWLVLRWQQAPGPGRAMLAGLVAGVATSTKYNGLGVGLPFVIAAAQRLWTGPRTARVGWRTVAIATGLAAVAGLIAFLALSPYVLIDWPRFVRDVTTRGDGLTRPHGIDVGPGWLWHARVTLPAVFGWPLYACSVAGTVGLLVRRCRDSIVVLAFPLAYAVVIGSLDTTFARYALPLVPFMALTAGWLTMVVARGIAARLRVVGTAPVAAALAIALAAPSVYQAVLLDRILSRPDTRVQASDYLGRHVSPGESIHLSGGYYARTPLSAPGRVDADVVNPDGAGVFPPDANGAAQVPTWIVVHRSPLVLYTTVPPSLEALTRERYDRVARFAATDAGHRATYDQQDALFLPLWGLGGVRHIGPTIDVYRRRGD